VAKRAKELADKYAPDAASSVMTVRASSEVVLEVRILEATRSSLQDMGFSGTISDGKSSFVYGTGLIGGTQPGGVLSLHGTAGSVSIDAVVAALEERGMVRTLARPNLVALSGEKASFLAGGEFPYPVPQGLNQTTIEFRTYGVKLSFLPTVQDNGLIRLQVAPEVSQLDVANSVRVNGVTVPGLVTRKADTTVELKNGDSLAMGGLFQHNYDNSLRQVPLLGDLPVLGTLFRSARWKRAETELVIIVTPRLIQPQDFAAAQALKSLGGPEPKAGDLVFNGQALDKPTTRDLGAKKP
jgi:pilus assembly protein CpaC